MRDIASRSPRLFNAVKKKEWARAGEPSLSWAHPLFTLKCGQPPRLAHQSGGLRGPRALKAHASERLALKHFGSKDTSVLKTQHACLQSLSQMARIPSNRPQDKLLSEAPAGSHCLTGCF